jgi:hypothetical protein
LGGISGSSTRILSRNYSDSPSSISVLDIESHSSYESQLYFNCSSGLGNSEIFLNSESSNGGNSYLYLYSNSNNGNSAEIHIKAESSPSTMENSIAFIHVETENSDSDGDSFIKIGGFYTKSILFQDSTLDDSDYGEEVIPLSSNTITEWNEFYANFGNVSIISAINQAAASGGGGDSGDVSELEHLEESIVVAGNTVVTGSFNIGANKGIIYLVEITQSSGSSNNIDLELSDANFSSSFNILYHIGQDSESNPLWNPSINSKWSDRNAWGFLGLINGHFYYRITNNDSTSITLNLKVLAHGKPNSVI